MTVSAWAQRFMRQSILELGLGNSLTDIWVVVHFYPDQVMEAAVFCATTQARGQMKWTHNVSRGGDGCYLIDRKRYPVVYGDKRVYTYTFKPPEGEAGPQ
jgi:hypothetical protein